MSGESEKIIKLPEKPMNRIRGSCFGSGALFTVGIVSPQVSNSENEIVCIKDHLQGERYSVTRITRLQGIVEKTSET